jgi:hypothetical protein
VETQSPPAPALECAEISRLRQEARREKNWKRWGPYLSERQWGTVREDYSADGDAWSYFPHAMAPSRAYRWGEDGLLGFCDRECRLCFALALWNGRDPLLKERLFGLDNHQGNHGEDVKEAYFYLDSTPTHSYCKALYKYPQREFPYARLLQENARRSRLDPEFELFQTGIFEDNAYFDVFVEYAKAAPDDIQIRVRVENRCENAALLHVLPTLWFRNTWSWGCDYEGCALKPRIAQEGPSRLIATHETLGEFCFELGQEAPFLFTENETNSRKLNGAPSWTPFTKDAFHEFVVHGRKEAVNPAGTGTKAAAHYQLQIPGKAGCSMVFRLYERSAGSTRSKEQGLTGLTSLTGLTNHLFSARIAEADAFYRVKISPTLSCEQHKIIRQAYAGLLWSKQFYHYVVQDWLAGDPDLPPPPPGHAKIRNTDWRHLFNSDVISMPDKWEYPWYASWDLAFHMIPLSRIDPDFAKAQLELLLREWYMHPNGQIPAYEWNFCDVNPPVHAWACWRVYKIAAPPGKRDTLFLERTFQKLLLNFTWWVNRKDIRGRHVFAGGFLGLDNIGLFDRSKPLPNGHRLAQADGTAWMAFFCNTMLSIALELALTRPAYEDIASKFFEHFVQIVDAMNGIGGCGLWDDADGFYYDQLLSNGTQSLPLKVRSMVGIIPLLAVEVLSQKTLDALPGFNKRTRWFLKNRSDLARHISYMEREGGGEHRLLAIPSKERLLRVLRYVLDEGEFLSPFGVRSLSRAYKDRPYILRSDGQEHRIDYEPGESTSGMFGGNSNWRGPIWFPLNYLLIEALERYCHFHGDALKVECPTGSGQWMNLSQVAQEIGRRLAAIFLPGPDGRRPCFGANERFANDPHWRDYLLFHEYYHAENGRGLGANHQTGWTALITRCLGLLK